LAIFDGKLIKPYFSDNDIALNSLVKSSLNWNSLLIERHYLSLDELIKWDVDATSLIKKSYNDMFKQLGFTTDEITEIENNEKFEQYIALTFYMFKSFSIGQLKPLLPIQKWTMCFESDEDNRIIKQLKNIDVYKETMIAKTILWNINDTDEESLNTFIKVFSDMLRGWYLLEIKVYKIEK
jgi:hypothetical protein